jgi:hypothetical protein
MLFTLGLSCGGHSDLESLLQNHRAIYSVPPKHKKRWSSLSGSKTKSLKKIGVTISMNIGGLYNLAYSLIEDT